MRALTALSFVALSTLAACGSGGGNACQQLCDEEEACGFGDADTCYDNYELALSLPGTRELTLSGCRTDLESLDCDATDTDAM